jgi:hypothetical protein
MNMLNELIKLADFLDESGMELFASKIDSQIIKIADYTEDSSKSEVYEDGLVDSSRMPDAIQSQYPPGRFLVKGGEIFLFIPTGLLHDYIKEGGLASRLEEGTQMLYDRNQLRVAALSMLNEAELLLETMPGRLNRKRREETFSEVSKRIIGAADAVTAIDSSVSEVIKLFRLISQSSSRGMRGYSLDKWYNITSSIINKYQSRDLMGAE